MSKMVKIEWNEPANIVSGTKLDDTQLCARARDEATSTEVPGHFEYDPKVGSELPPGRHELRSTFYPRDTDAYATAEQSTWIKVAATSAAKAPSGHETGSVAATASEGGPASASAVKINGLVKFGRAPKDPIAGVCVILNDRDCGQSTQRETDRAGSYAFDARPGSNVSIEFPSIANFGGRKVALLDPQLTYLRPCEDIGLPDTRYVSRGCEISGRVVRAPDSTPLAGASITLHQASKDGDTAMGQATTDSNGRFSFVTEHTGRLKVSFEVYETDAGHLLPSASDADVFVDGQCPADVCLPPVTYSAVTAQLCGFVNDAANRPLKGILVELWSADGVRTPCSATTNDSGLWTFPGLQPGSYQVHFQKAIPNKSLELVGEQQTQAFGLKAGDAKLAATVAYQPEPHIIERRVLIGDQPADGILVDVRRQGALSALQAARTVNGLVSFVLDEEGTYEVRVYPDPQASGDPLVDLVEVHSTTSGTTRIAAPAASSQSRRGQLNGAGTTDASESVGGAIKDLASYPVLTEEIGYPPSPVARSGGVPASSAGMPALGQTAMKAISDVLGWQVKSDPKAFLGALNASFALKEVGGHMEASWTPRTYAVQTDLSGGITGAQASVFTRAKSALEQSLPLLDGLYSLFEEAKPEDIAALRATVRSQFTDLVNEFGLLGGPRIARVTQFFLLLIGQPLPQQTPLPSGFTLITEPDQLTGSLGNLRQELGLSIAADQVNTVEDEQNVTNYRIVSDHITSLAQSWLNNLSFFGLQTATPFFGTQLVLLSRQLSVIAEKTNEVRFTLDSVFIGPADRQTLQIRFQSPDPPMFLEDLLSWIDGFASEEGPRLIAEGGKFAVGQSFVPIAQQLQRLVQGLIKTQQSGSLPPGFGTTRVKNALNDLANTLQQLVSLATPISHVITPEPEPPLAMLGINPNVISAGPGTAFVTIVGTGFDVNNQAGLTHSSVPTLHIVDTGVLSDNLAYLKITTNDLPSGPYALTIGMTNRNYTTTTLTTTLTVAG